MHVLLLKSHTPVNGQTTVLSKHTVSVTGHWYKNCKCRSAPEHNGIVNKLLIVHFQVSRYIGDDLISYTSTRQYTSHTSVLNAGYVCTALCMTYGNVTLSALMIDSISQTLK